MFPNNFHYIFFLFLKATYEAGLANEPDYRSSGLEVIKLFSCSTQLSMIFFLLINVKMPTIVGILTFMNGKNSILGLSEPEKDEFLDINILLSI